MLQGPNQEGGQLGENRLFDQTFSEKISKSVKKIKNTKSLRNNVKRIEMLKFSSFDIFAFPVCTGGFETSYLGNYCS